MKYFIVILINVWLGISQINACTQNKTINAIMIKPKYANESIGKLKKLICEHGDISKLLARLKDEYRSNKVDTVENAKLFRNYGQLLAKLLLYSENGAVRNQLILTIVKDGQVDLLESIDGSTVLDTVLLDEPDTMDLFLKELFNDKESAERLQKHFNRYRGKLDNRTMKVVKEHINKLIKSK